MASTASLVATAGLGLVAVVATAGVIAGFNVFVAGLVLGAGLIIAAWATFAVWRRQGHRPAPSLGRSRTRDCRQARWAPRRRVVGAPHPPSEAQRRVRPCPGSRHT
jgi:hypothetical protein